MDTQKRVLELAVDLLTPPRKVKMELVSLMERTEKWVKHEGLNGIKRQKSLFDYALDTFLGQPTPEIPWIKKSKSGDPDPIKHTLEWGKTHPKEALSLLRFHELYNDSITDEKCLAAMESITAPSTATNSPDYIEAILEEARALSVDQLKVDVGSVPMFTSGPNGTSILSAHLDARAHHRYGTDKQIIEFADRVASHGRGVKTSQTVVDMIQHFSSFDGTEELGRLVFLPEKSGKLRVIATGDYITQTAMKPIHDTINMVLRKVTGDYTFDQDAGKAWMKKQTGIQKWMASYDLSSATDRLPAWLQAKVIDAVLPGQLGDSWLDILSNRDFLVNLPSGKQKYVKYSVGQPMGYYSSFAAFALLHHCVVRAAYRLAHKGHRPRKQYYGIIGDDMVITDRKAGELYVKIIEDIGGVVNLTKSRISNTPGSTIAEFAKTWAINGKDITPISLRAVRSGLNNPMSVPSMLKHIEDKLDRSLKVKKLKLILQEYWPAEANTLIGLIPVPQKLGGFGKPDSNPLLDAIGGSGSNTLRLFMATKVHQSFRKIINITEDDLREIDGNRLDPISMRIALGPVSKLIRDREAEVGFSMVYHSRKEFLQWAVDEDIPISTLVDWYRSMVAPLPVKFRESLPPDTLSWLKACEDNRRLPSAGSDSDIALQYAALEFLG